MGYAAGYFDGHVGKWLRAGWLPPGGRLIEFGAQEFYGDQVSAKRATAAFLRSRGVDKATIERLCACSTPLSVAEVFAALGIDYTAIDVDNAYGSRYFDLNTFAPPIEWRAAFDLVNNEGTIEHLVNPINGFQVTHELLKVYGVAIHSMPLFGHCEHGFVYPTLKFYACLIGVNQYELLQAKIEVAPETYAATDKRFRFVGDDGREMPELKLASAWLRLVYRKTRATEFRAPFDHLVVDDPDALGAKLSANYAAYSRHRPGADGKRDPVGDEFERAMELQRREHENEHRMQLQEHNHADALARDLQQREHEHTDQRPHGTPPAPQPAATPHLALMTIAIMVVLNAAALFLRAAAPFAVGLAFAFAPSALAWTSLPTNRSTAGRMTRYACRLLLLGSAAAFGIGCLTSPA